ncbi:hypothetical protein LXA43DRAFT_1084869 [Ganoderma leucocontextum]|nr:hypothetical protein LXA43DRAFT_1084869 [Ganoderma leucocontextum]
MTQTSYLREEQETLSGDRTASSLGNPVHIHASAADDPILIISSRSAAADTVELTCNQSSTTTVRVMSESNPKTNPRIKTAGSSSASTWLFTPADGKTYHSTFPDGIACTLGPEIDEDDSELDIPPEEFQRPYPDTHATLFGGAIIDSILRYLGLLVTDRHTRSLLQVDYLCDSRGRPEVGLILGSTYIGDALEERYCSKLKALISPNEDAKWYLGFDNWQWQRQVPKQVSKPKVVPMSDESVSKGDPWRFTLPNPLRFPALPLATIPCSACTEEITTTGYNLNGFGPASRILAIEFPALHASWILKPIPLIRHSRIERGDCTACEVHEAAE